MHMPAPATVAIPVTQSLLLRHQVPARELNRQPKSKNEQWSCSGSTGVVTHAAGGCCCCCRGTSDGGGATGPAVFSGTLVHRDSVRIISQAPGALSRKSQIRPRGIHPSTSP